MIIGLKKMLSTTSFGDGEMELGSHLSTIRTLHAWETKLYDEVNVHIRSIDNNGVNCIRDNEIDKGISSLESAAKIQPWYVTAWNSLGKAFCRRNIILTALEALCVQYKVEFKTNVSIVVKALQPPLLPAALITALEVHMCCFRRAKKYIEMEGYDVLKDMKKVWNYAEIEGGEKPNEEIALDICKLCFLPSKAKFSTTMAIIEIVLNAIAKVSRLLAVLYTLSPSNNTFMLSSKSLYESHWASYFQQASIGMSLNNAFVSRLKNLEATVTADQSNGSYLPSSSHCLWLPPQRVKDLENFILNFFNDLPEITIVCMNFLEDGIERLLYELLPHSDTKTWIMLSRLNSRSIPISRILPIRKILEKTTPDPVINKENDSNPWVCHGSGTTLDKLAPEYESIHYAAHKIWKMGTTLVDKRRNTLDGRLSKFIEYMQTEWIEPCQNVLLGERSNDKSFNMEIGKLKKDLKANFDLDTKESFLKLAVKCSCDMELEFLEAILTNGCYTNGEQLIAAKFIQKMNKCPAALLMGCDSGRLTLCGSLAPKGAPTHYLLGGTPALLCNLWTMGDREVGHFTNELVLDLINKANTGHAQSIGRLSVIDLSDAEMESLLGIVMEEGDRYHRMSSFMMKVLKWVTKKDRTHWSLCDLMDSVVDRDCIIDKEHVSGVIEDYRAKIINELNELHENLLTDSSNTTTKQMIKGYIVAFEGGVEHEEPADADLAKRLHKSEELQMMILLNYAPIKNKSSTIISKKSDDEMITKKKKFEGQLCSSRILKQPKYIYQEDEDDLDTWDCGPDAGTVDVLCYSRP
ncbi:zinc finger, GRF-type containing protein [Tanacetum coccineum]